MAQPLKFIPPLKRNLCTQIVVKGSITPQNRPFFSRKRFHYYLLFTETFTAQ